MTKLANQLKTRLHVSVAKSRVLIQNKPAENTPTAEKQSLRFRAGGFATLRKNSGLTAAEMGQLIGVSAQSVYRWEQEKSRPRASQLPAIAAVRKFTKKQAHEALTN